MDRICWNGGEERAYGEIIHWRYLRKDSLSMLKLAQGVRKHIGPVAQDFYAAFNLGEDDKHISTVDASGVALAAIQSLDQQVKEQDSRIVALQQQNAILQQQNAALDTRLAALERSSGAPIGPASGSLSGWNLVALAVAAGMLVAALIVRRGYSQKRGI